MIQNWNGHKELQIFDRFEIDYNLPKNKNSTLTSSIVVGGATSTSNVSFIGQSLQGFSVSSTPVDSANYGEKKRKSFVGFINRMQKRFSEKKTKQITVVEFFTGLETNMDKLENLNDLAAYYENALIKAKKFGQIALCEKIANMIDVVKFEANLCDEFKFVTEKQVIDLHEKTDKAKNLKLTWIKNFNRIIPDAVLEAKEEADKKMVFDNYVVLHYDPENTDTNLTKEEIERKKDPILFGVFKNSRKLYYIADWKDEYCDLTLDEMFVILGDTVGEVNNSSVKTFIDSIKA